MRRIRASAGNTATSVALRVMTSSRAPRVSVARLPETDDGLPGAGPIRRGEWFSELWAGRHAAWAGRGAVDRDAIVFVGDSITQDWGDDFGGSFPGLKLANRGISGDTTRGVLIRIHEDVLSLEPRAVVVLAGTNDLEELADPETIAGNMGAILAELRAHRAEMPIVLCEVFPSSSTLSRSRERIRKLNALYAGLARAVPRVTLLETWAVFADEHGDARPSQFPDLLHPNPSGYAEWARVLRPVLAHLAVSGGVAAGGAPR